MLVAEQSSGRAGLAPFSLHPICSSPVEQSMKEEEEEEEEEVVVHFSESLLRPDRGTMTFLC